MNTTNPDLGSIELDPINQQHQIDIVSPSQNQPSLSALLNLPCRDLLKGKIFLYRRISSTHLRLRWKRSRRIDAIHGRVEIIKGNPVKVVFIDRMSD
ncbi:hypothetical protein OSB04_012232 [Centaurea solstitialis]|uniref:Uncharacterized protein n=1 Tax=Centaurea solstitialis TaxID=347529 RepID=A0AA38TVR3_9ASTR|nr:hypothetical protein OSB04_012232 [Centaurea solstitialis]